MAEIITELSVAELQKLQKDMGNNVLILKFGAEWCGPCKRIAPTYHAFINTQPANIIFADINVDDNIDLYMVLKRNKMITGIPVFFAYYGDNKKREKWFIPDDSLIGADEVQVAAFFQRCKAKAANDNSGKEGYSYFT